MAHRTKLTAKKKRQILEEISKDSNVTRACRYCGISRTSVYALREKDEQFRRDMEAAVERGVDALIDEARRRAHRGVSEPVYHQGKLVGFKKNHSDTLLMFLVKAKRPEYREKYIDIPTGAKFHLTMDFGNPDEEGEKTDD